MTNHLIPFVSAIAFSLCLACNPTTTEDTKTTTSTVTTTKDSTIASTPNPTPKKVALGSNYTDYIPKDYHIVYSEEGKNLIAADLNGDEKMDFAVLVVNEKKVPEQEYSEGVDVRLMIFEGQEDGTYLKKTQSGDLKAEFIFNNEYTAQLSLKNKNVLALKHQEMRHHYELKFRYESKHSNYMIIGSEYNNYGNATNDGSGNISINFLTNTQVAELNEFDYDKEELKELPKKTTKIDFKLTPLSALKGDNIYNFLGS